MSRPIAHKTFGPAFIKSSPIEQKFSDSLRRHSTPQRIGQVRRCAQQPQLLKWVILAPNSGLGLNRLSQKGELCV